MAASNGAWCSECRGWKTDFHSDTTVCTDCRPVRKKVSLEGVTKVCCNCQRELSSRCYIYDQSSVDRLMAVCRTCHSYKKGKPPLADVLEFESSLRTILDSAVEYVDHQVNERRTELEIYVYQQMKTAGLLEHWSPPVWVHKSSIRMSDDYQVSK